MSSQINDVVIVSALRTPIAGFRSSFSELSSKDLGKIVAKDAISKAGLEPKDIGETIVGCVLTAGIGQNLARQVAIAAGVSDSSSATTVNKVCSSGLKAAMLGSQSLQLGSQDIVLVLGVESMSSTPYYMARGNTPYGGLMLTDGIQRDGLTDAMLDQPMGLCAEKTAKDYQLSRQDQDEFAIRSYRRATAAWETGVFDSEIVPVTVRPKRGPETIVKIDEEYSRLNEAKMRTLAPAFLKDGTGTITAANASTLNDGAAALVLTTMRKASELGLTPLARVIAFGERGTNPVDFSISPSIVVPQVLHQAGISKDQVDLWEINEAFSLTPLANVKELDIDMNKVNIHGGAVAFGHPIGMSGARILVHLVHSLPTGGKGMATICNGGGEATAMLIEKL